MILSHVDSRTGAGIFVNLGRVTHGAAIHVDRVDGRNVTFRATTVWQVPKTRFPADLVHLPTLRLQLGPSPTEPPDNVIVFAV